MNGWMWDIPIRTDMCERTKKENNILYLEITIWTNREGATTLNYIYSDNFLNV